MRLTRTLLLFALVLFAAGAQAQGYVFKVLATKGSPQYKDAGQWKPLTNGVKLQAGSQIKVNSSGYVGLIHVTGKTMQVKTPGSHNVDQLSAKISGGGEGFTSQYVNYMADKVSGTGTANTRYDVTGSVHRGDDDATGIWLVASRDFSVRTQPTDLVWNAESEEGTVYEVLLTDLGEQPLYRKETNQTSASIDLSKVDFSQVMGGVCLLSVNAKTGGYTSGRYKVHVLRGDEAKQLDGDLAKMGEELDAESALDQLVYASYYEDKGLVLDAMNSYRNAMEMEPEVDFFRDAYKNFLYRNGIPADGI